MNVLIAWSGALSREVAVSIKNWLKPTLQAAQPFMSTKDIAMGPRWFTELAEKMQASDVVIVLPDQGDPVIYPRFGGHR